MLKLDREECECVPLPWKECHPIYGKECDQFTYDEEQGRKPFENPYQNESWYEESADMPIIFGCGDIECPKNYTEHKRRCECMPFEWMECHREMYPTIHCNQAEFDHMNGRDPKENPY